MVCTAGFSRQPWVTSPDAVIRAVQGGPELTDVTRMDDRLLGAVMYRAHEVAFLVDTSGSVTFVPEMKEPPLGYHPNESIGQSVFAFVHPDDQPEARALLARAVASSTPHEPIKLRGLARDGTWRIVEIAVTNLLSNPVVGALLVNMRDLTERAAMEEALRASEARYRSIAETAQEGIWLLDDNGCTLFANETLVGIIGRPLDEIDDLNVFDVIDSDAREEARRRLSTRRDVGHEVYELP